MTTPWDHLSRSWTTPRTTAISGATGRSPGGSPSLTPLAVRRTGTHNK